MEPLCACAVVGGGGTRYDCFGGESPSESSTLTYRSLASPRECSGSQARRREDERRDFEVLESEEVGRDSGTSFC
jgi:hypothetical protein